MIMVPRLPIATDSKAELVVFERLKQAFARDAVHAQTAYALHSLNICSHDYKRFAEIDFVLCTTAGIFVLEVKGGAVSCTQGCWTFENEQGQKTVNREGPFKQANSGLQGLRTQLEREFGEAAMHSVCLGYGVILVNTTLNVRSAEWEAPMLCNQRALRDLEGWLGRFFAYWENRNKAAGVPIKPLTLPFIRELVQFIRPDFAQSAVEGDVIPQIMMATVEPPDNGQAFSCSEPMLSAPAPALSLQSVSRTILSAIAMPQVSTPSETTIETPVLPIFMVNIVAMTQVLNTVLDYLAQFSKTVDLSKITLVFSDDLNVERVRLYRALKPHYRYCQMIDEPVTQSQRYPDLTLMNLSHSRALVNTVIIGVCPLSAKETLTSEFLKRAGKHCIMLYLSD